MGIVSFLGRRENMETPRPEDVIHGSRNLCNNSECPTRSFIPGFLARVDRARHLVYHMNNNKKRRYIGDRGKEKRKKTATANTRIARVARK